MWTRQEVKETGKKAFQANYWRSVLVAFLLTLLAGTAVGTVYSNGGETTVSIESSGELQQIPPEILVGAVLGVLLAAAAAMALRIFLYNPLRVGAMEFFRQNVQGSNATLDAVMLGFRNYGRTFLTLFLKDLWILLGMIFFVVPGIVAAYAYRMVPYILAEEPELSAGEVLAKSKALMRGNKWALFVFDLSFLGWTILGLMTLNLVNIFWTDPYRRNAEAALYLKLKNG